MQEVKAFLTIQATAENILMMVGHDSFLLKQGSWSILQVDNFTKHNVVLQNQVSITIRRQWNAGGAKPAVSGTGHRSLQPHSSSPQLRKAPLSLLGFARSFARHICCFGYFFFLILVCCFSLSWRSVAQFFVFWFLGLVVYSLRGSAACDGTLHGWPSVFSIFCSFWLGSPPLFVLLVVLRFTWPFISHSFLFICYSLIWAFVCLFISVRKLSGRNKVNTGIVWRKWFNPFSADSVCKIITMCCWFAFNISFQCQMWILKNPIKNTSRFTFNIDVLSEILGGGETTTDWTPRVCVSMFQQERAKSAPQWGLRGSYFF